MSIQVAGLNIKGDNMNYVSSIIIKYCDITNVKRDSKTLNEIVNRQGSTFLIDVLASYIGETALKLKLNSNDRDILIKDLTNELKDALQERL
jgi:hypothetical protein